VGGLLGAFALGGLLGAPVSRAIADYFAPTPAPSPPPSVRLAVPPPTSPLDAPLRPDAVIDAELARDFEQAHGRAQLDDSDASLASLTLPSLRVPLTRRTLRFVRYFTEDPKGRRSFAERLGRFGRYREPIEGALREAGLPEELAWVAAVESGFDPRAVSPAGAVGLWQLMPATGASYGLEASAWHDERRSVARSTTAAVTHLRDLYERFGRWDLALAAYNYGAQGVADAIERAAAVLPPEARTEGIGLAELASVRAVPKETASYVPLVTAFALVASNRARFGFTDVPLAEPLASADVTVPAGTRLATVARAAGVSLELVRELNPELLHDRAPPSGGEVLVHVPAERVAQLLATFPTFADNELVGESASEPGASPAPSLDDALAAALGQGGEEGAPDAPIGVGSPLLAAWASLVDPLPPRARWLGQNRVPELDLGAVLAPRQGSAEGSYLALVGARRGRRGLFELIPPELLRGEDGRLARIDTRRDVSATTTPQRNDAEPLVSGPVVLRNVPASREEAPRERAVEPAPPPPSPPPPEPVRSLLRDDVELVVLRRDDASEVSIELRLAPLGDVAPLAVARTSTLHVPPDTLDVGLALALGELTLEGVAGSPEGRAALRRGLSADTRSALAERPYGPAWLALGDALFPAGHPLEGWVLGATSSRDVLGELLLEARALPRHATLTLSGPVSAERARSLALAALPSRSSAAAGPIVPRSAPLHVDVTQAVPDTRVLLAWLGPGEGEPRELALRVAMELLAGKEAPLRAELVERRGLLAALSARTELSSRASVLSLELTPAASHNAEEVVVRTQAALATALRDTRDGELERARTRLRGRLLAEKRGAERAPEAGAPTRAASARLREAVNPGRIDASLRALAALTRDDVEDAARTYLAPEQVVIVTTTPSRSAR
jgi:membrane-bound lytic murein transglycosylase D